VVSIARKTRSATSPKRWFGQGWRIRGLGSHFREPVDPVPSRAVLYGYGVTREIEQLLKSIGLTPTPFLPSTFRFRFVFYVALPLPDKFVASGIASRYRQASLAGASDGLMTDIRQATIKAADTLGTDSGAATHLAQFLGDAPAARLG
jgi:hypothetical protein